jgi:hypothetical protein
MLIQREAERVPQHDPRSQGDIIRIEWPEGKSGPNLGVVINADCDLAHAKTDGVIAFLPVYSFHDYLSQFWASGHAQEVMKSAIIEVLKMVKDKDASGLITWLKESGPHQVCSSITALAKLKNVDAERLQRELNRLSIAQNIELSPISRFQQICAVAPDPGNYARSQITNAKKSMGDGHFFISDLAVEQSIGFIIRMRRIYTMPEEDYFVSESEQRSRSQGDTTTAVRIARLTERYRFKVLQLFAQQYSRVGLPDEVTALSALAIDDLVHTFAGVWK